MNWVLFRRQLADRIAFVGAALATVFGLVFLFWILWTTFSNGVEAIGPKLFTEMTPPPGADGGLLNALYGSAVMIVVAIVVGTPIGLCAGTYLAEHGRNTKLAAAVRFVNDILLSAPSIVLGLFIYELIVVPMRHFSGLAGGLALALILVPVVVRTSDEALRLIPDRMREAAFALGLPRWKVSLQVLFSAAMSGIVTGILLGVARISGETAPLLFTALNNQFWSSDLNGPLANLPVVIFQYAMSPYDSWHSLAWAGALILTVFVLALNITVRLFARRRAFK
ncbi:phosphate ABC transporter permease PstA [Tsuneonella mangrovi]|uniref:phosphate ABC transporter permease PstA n=1 Tax=Tsuneonella mangrovi TaxID=1982042 RepID=UPI000BA230D2|nr:phosphate ABC transporter permease PstA [Tsuneonella mangrovi]